MLLREITAVFPDFEMFTNKKSIRTTREKTEAKIDRKLNYQAHKERYIYLIYFVCLGVGKIMLQKKKGKNCLTVIILLQDHYIQICIC